MLIISPAKAFIGLIFLWGIITEGICPNFNIPEPQLVYIEYIEYKTSLSWQYTDVNWLKWMKRFGAMQKPSLHNFINSHSPPPSFQPSICSASCPCIGRDLSSDCHRPHLDLVVWQAGNKREGWEQLLWNEGNLQLWMVTKLQEGADKGSPLKKLVYLGNALKGR